MERHAGKASVALPRELLATPGVGAEITPAQCNATPPCYAPLAGGIMLRPNATLLIATHTSPKKIYKIEILTSVVTSQHSSVAPLSDDCVRLRVCMGLTQVRRFLRSV